MSRLTVAKAKPLDLLEAVGMAGAPLVRNRRTFGLYARQLTASEAVTFRADGELVAIGGIYDLGLDEWECWLMAGPALAANAGDLVRDLRADLRVARAITQGYFVAYIDPASVAGPRIATILGFHPCGPTQTAIGPLETWRSP